MARKSLIKADLIDPVQVCKLALKQIKCAADYHQIGSVNSTEVLTAAWEQLTTAVHQCIADLINNNAQPDPQVLADELMACGAALELKRIKAENGDMGSKSSLEAATPI